VENRKTAPWWGGFRFLKICYNNLMSQKLRLQPTHRILPNFVWAPIFVGIILFIAPSFVSAVSLGQKADFFVKSDYDSFQREEISATLKTIGEKAYFYVDDKWWGVLDAQKKEEVEQSLRILDSEFHNRIYPKLTTIFGSEWIPGIDNDLRITILIHPMKGEAGGYFNSGDEYSRFEVSNSNQKEMVYLNANYIAEPLTKSFLAHEFMHLITFNQKDKIQGIGEEVWLNEARAEYAPTLVGYDSEYEGSNLQRRVKQFLEEPSNSITEWQNVPADYGALNLFTQYLVEHYGAKILIDSLKLKTVGIESLNQALAQNYFEEDFSQIFTDWTVAIFVNDCSLAPLDSEHLTGWSEKYCYKNENLKEIRVTPSINFLPLYGKSTLGVSQTTKNWSGNWFKFIGGKGVFKIEFIGNPENLFKILYLTQDLSGKYSLNFFSLDEKQRGEISIPEFGEKVSSVIIIPSVQTKKSGFEDSQPDISFFWSASILAKEEKEISKFLEKPISEMSKQEILNKIAEIEQLLTQLKTQFSQLEEKELEASYQKFDKDLFYGLRNDPGVEKLQEFLKSQGPEIYPEGLVTGNFLTATQSAVFRFQEKYAGEILKPLNLEKGTGYVGQMTRAKINELLGK